MEKNIKVNKKYSLLVKGYTKRFKNFVAVDDVSFSVKHGKIHGFIGPNGAGKTTTIKAIIGAYDKSDGEIYIEGFQAGTAKAKSKLGYIPERASFPTNLTCMEYLVSMAELSGFGAKDAKKKAEDILEELGLTKHKYRKPFDFSSGMKKKILVAQALMLEPTLLVLDEPAANLDPTARKQMFEMFKKVKSNGCSILISSHILSELQDIIDEVTFISQGKIRFSGSINEVTSEKGVIVNFLNENGKKEKEIIKKYQLKAITTGWTKITKTGAESRTIAKKLISENVIINSISFLESNLNHAYDSLVLAHGRESGVSEDEKTTKFFFSKLFGKKQTKKIKIMPEKTKNKTTKKVGK